jgi:hypothetical protein
MSVSANELAGTLNDMISKQAQAILGIGSLREIGGLDLQAEQQSEIGKQIEMLQDEKCRLYERPILGEIDKEGYKSAIQKAESEISCLNSVYANLVIENKKLSLIKAVNEEQFRSEKNVTEGTSLTRQIVDMLISKVSVFPGNRIEIFWKLSGFGG